jgi:hypothetical protein
MSVLIDNVLYNLDSPSLGQATVANNRAGTQVYGNLTIPNTVKDSGFTYTVTAIVDQAFDGVGSRLTGLVLPTNSSFKAIAAYAFRSTNISEITIPNNITRIFGWAFEKCNLLTTINIDPTNSTLDEIVESCFIDCTSLTSVIIPKTVTGIGRNAFAYCTKLSTVYFYGTRIPIGDKVMENDDRTFDGIAKPATAYYVNGTDITLLQSTNWFTNYVILNPPCFKEDTLILTNKGYRRIQELRKGDLVKTLLNGFLKIDMIGKKNIYHKACIEDRIENQLYKCSHENFKEVFEPLVLTGCHSILVDDYVSEEQRKRTIEVNGDTYVTDRKYRLPACVDERTTVYEIPGTYTIYHLALENPDYYMNYGIYANGLLVETSSRRYLKELSGMELIE